MFNAISPYGRVVSYEPAPKKGIFVRPASDAAPGGWSPERHPDTGAPILPGTPDGARPYRVLRREADESGEWNCVHHAGTFFYGEIDWRGGLKSISKPQEGRWRLSYHGPNSRYFGTDAFSYGNEETHNNVYMEGRCIAVAPFPVLGAALQVEELGDGNREITLVVACKSGTADAFYTRRFKGGGVLRNAYTEEFRNSSMELFHEIHNPDGWVALGSFTLDTSVTQGDSCDVYGARAPWFFNESGDKAVCTRECDVSFSIEAVPVTHRGYNHYRATLTNSAVSYEDLGNTNGFSFDVETEILRQPNHVSVTRWPDYRYPLATHVWEVYTVDQKMRMSGDYRVAVDYAGDEMKYLTARVQYLRRHGHHYYRGLDEYPHPEWVPHPDPLNPNPFDEVVSNDYDFRGDYYFKQNAGAGIPASEPSGITGPFVYTNDFIMLVPDGSDSTHWIYRRLSGSRSEYETGTRDPADTILYYMFHLSLFPHFWEFRNSEQTAVYGEEKVFQGSWGVPAIQDFRYETEHYYDGREKDYEKFMVRNLPVSTVSGQNPNPWQTEDHFIHFYAEVTKPSEVGEKITNNRACMTIHTLWPMELLENWPTTVPGPIHFYARQFFDMDSGMYPLHQHLQSISKSYRNCGFGVDDFGNTAYSVEYMDHNDEVAYYSSLWKGDMSSLTKAEGENARFFPIGVS